MVRLTTVNEIKISAIIQRSSIPDADYEINPYVGCVYNCIYCYARHVQDSSNHIKPWGSFIDVKTNAADLINEQAGYYSKKDIFIGSVTDPYPPCEKEYRVTRAILEKLVSLKPKLSIQTKSDMVLRDIDLLKQFDQCYVGLTITTLDDNIRSTLEDAAASVEKRLKALKQLNREGLETYIFIGPLLPRVTDWKAIIEKTSSFTDFYLVELLNIEGSIWNAVKDWLKKYHPHLLSEYEKIYFSSNFLLKPVNRFFWYFFGRALTGFNAYRDSLYDEIRAFASKKKIEVIFNDLLY
jgi:DNA repair photolyase